MSVASSENIMATAPVDVSVVIPVYGSAQILPELLRQLDAVLSQEYGQGNFEAVLVNDCSPDGAWATIKTLAETHPWLVGINLRKNAGQHNAVMAGLAQARGKVIVTMDDDLQHAPADIPRLVAEIHAGADVCFAAFAERKHAWWKKMGSRFNDAVAQRLLKKPKGLYLSPFRSMDAAIREEVLRYHGPFVYLDGLIMQSTNNITMVKVEHHSRGDGNSGYSLGKSIALWMQMATSFSVVPLRLVSVAGSLASAIGLLIACLIVWQKLSRPELAVGWASIMVATLLLSGFQLLALGAIGEYIGRIFLTLNHKPQYVIKEQVGGSATQA